VALAIAALFAPVLSPSAGEYLKAAVMPQQPN
jgi:hypothetical protein